MRKKPSKEELIFWKKYWKKKKKKDIFSIIKGPKKWNIPEKF